MPQFKLYIYNDSDLDNKLYPDGFIEEIILDDKYGIEYLFEDIVAKVEQTEVNGKNRIQKVTSFYEYSFTFIREVSFAEFISEIKLHKYFYFTDHKSDSITPDQWDYEIKELSNDFDPNLRLITIKIYTDFETSVNSDTNITLYSDPNVVPVASNLRLLGTGAVGNTTVLTYTYSDNDSDIEGATTFQWYRYDNLSKSNMQIISGATSQTYVVTTNEYNKYISCMVTPVAATGETPGIPVHSPLLKCAVNSAPEAQSLGKTPPGAPKVGVTQWGTYTYYDADGDSEGSTIVGWYIAQDINGANRDFVFAAYDEVEELYYYIPQPEDDYRYLAFVVRPIAATGIINGDEEQTNYQEIISD